MSVNLLPLASAKKSYESDEFHNALMDICRAAKQQGLAIYTHWVLFTGCDDFILHNGEETQRVDALPDAADIISSIHLSFSAPRATFVGAYVAKK